MLKHKDTTLFENYKSSGLLDKNKINEGIKYMNYAYSKRYNQTQEYSLGLPEITNFYIKLSKAKIKFKLIISKMTLMYKSFQELQVNLFIT